MASVPASFEFLGPAHLTVMVLTVSVPVVLILVCRVTGSKALRRGIGWAIAAMLVINELVYWWWELSHYGVGHFVHKSLPLHLCGVGLFLTAYVLIRPHQLAYETAYFWGLAGTLLAVITPELPEGFPRYKFFEYFITHSGIVVGVLFATFTLRMRPRRGSVLRTFLLSNAFMLFLAGVNTMLGSNYMFLCTAPQTESPFFFLPWPWYILFLEPVALLFFVTLYSPFWTADRIRGRRAADAAINQARSVISAQSGPSEGIPSPPQD